MISVKSIISTVIILMLLLSNVTLICIMSIGNASSSSIANASEPVIVNGSGSMPFSSNSDFGDALGPSLDSVFVSYSIPASMMAGQSYDLSVTFRNTGSMNWSEASLIRMLSWGDTSALGVNGDCDDLGCGYPEYAIGQDDVVLPGDSYTWNFTVMPTDMGTYMLGFAMARNEGSNVTGFGSYGYATVTVIPASLESPDAEYVSDTIPVSMLTGVTYNATITFRNIGTNS
jgi:hypothetical protein